jgi:hypothetical protein
MKRAAAVKSCGWIDSGRSKTAGPQAGAAGSPTRQSRICVRGWQYQITHEANELRQYPEHNATLFVKYF